MTVMPVNHAYKILIIDIETPFARFWRERRER